MSEHDDGSGLSGHSINGRDLTWRELVELEHAERNRYSEIASLLNDLDRCAHGRHEGDTCSGCGGPSKGNPRLADDRVLGFTMSGRSIRYPTRGGANHNDPSAWVA